MIPAESILIKGPVKLTASQSRIVDYLLNHTQEAAFLSAAELGRRLSVSDATVVRLSQTLGFEGWGHLRQHLQGLIKAKLDTVSRMRQASDQVVSVEDILPNVLRADQENLRLAAQTVSIESYGRMVKKLQHCREIHVIGLRSALSLAHFLSSGLRYLGRRVYLLTAGAGDLWAELAHVGPEDTLVALSFPRYTRLTVEVAQHFSDQGAQVLSITDSAFSPLAELSTEALYCPFKLESYMESFVAALSILNSLVTGIAYLDGERSFEGLTRLEQFWDKKDVYFQAAE